MSSSLEGKNYVVTWALGHLVTLADPEEYDRKYEKWEMATLPMLPKEMKLVVIRQTGRQFSVVKTQLFRKDIGEIIIATDAGRLCAGQCSGLQGEDCRGRKDVRSMQRMIALLPCWRRSHFYSAYFKA